MTIFSKRYAKALIEKRLRLTLPHRLRKRIWLTLVEYNHTYYPPDPNDNWTTQTTVLEEIPSLLKREYGTDELLGYNNDGDRVPVDLAGLVERGWPSHVLDVIEVFYRQTDADKRSALQREVNRIFHEEASPWRLADGDFFQIDSEFLALELERAQDLLQTAGFGGVLDEFREARNDLTSGDHRGAIQNACNAFESAMKATLGIESGSASVLIRKMREEGQYDDLPQNVRASFGEQVLMALPFLGNRLARHGQGAEVLEVPREYAELAVGLAGLFINFRVQKSLAAKLVEPAPAETALTDADDDIPF